MRRVRVLSRERSVNCLRDREVTLGQVREQFDKAMKSAERLREFVDRRPARLFREPKKAA